MIGLIAFFFAFLWLGICVVLAIKIPQWFKLKHSKVIAVVLIPVFLVAPFVDDYLGMREFDRLCQGRDALTYVSPDANKVMRAMRNSPPDALLNGTWIPINSSRSEYVDMDTGKIFFSTAHFSTKGGFLYRAGLGLDGIRTCAYSDAQISQANALYKKLKIEELLENGRKTK